MNRRSPAASRPAGADTEALYRSVDAFPFGIYLVDADFRIVQASRLAREAFATVDPLIGTDAAVALRTIWPEPFASEAIGHFRTTLETGRTYNSPNTVEQRADRDAVEAYDWWLERIVMPDGRFGVACYFYDLTERQRLIAALRESEERQAFLLRLSDATRRLTDPVDVQEAAARELGEHLCVDRAFYFTVDHGEDGPVYVIERDYFARPGGQAIVGRHRQASYGMEILQLLDRGKTVILADTQTAETLTDRQRAAYRAVGAASGVAVPLIKGGRHVAGFAVIDARPRAWTAAEVDLVEQTAERTWEAAQRAQAEAAIRANQAELRAALDAKDEFLGLVSHELRTPMAVILGMSELIARDGLSPERVKDLGQDIAASAAVLNALLENMLLIARLDHDEAVRSLEPILLGRTVATVVDRHARADPGREYRVSIADASVTEVQPGWIERVVDNLVSNAAKYGAPGRPIEVVVDASDTTVRCVVRNEGAVLDPHALARAFEPFYRAPEARAAAPGGGLGLAVCRRIVEITGGEVWGRPREGGGAEFGFWLPRTSGEE
ncbi:MAG: ATP-binding protein [Chloroflexota bacterium]